MLQPALFATAQEAPVTATETAIDQQAQVVGNRIRALRRARGLTLVQLATRAHLSHPFLSQLERGLARPSMASLERIARALSSSQVELLAALDGAGPGDRQPGSALVRATEGSRGAYGSCEARLLVHGKRKFSPMEIRGRNSGPGDYFTHDEDEFVHVVEGTVVVDLQGQGTAVLTPGDSLYIVGGTAHRWCAVDPVGYRLFVVKEKPEAL